ncbi:GATA-4/5/6 transcription factor [Handroanthus impetiginosus]|uniref:GATA-4/5/6 transcription factor n=1 Tax=Handroanthus impetiginosus TaxID=429701 RepID=A0A2G9GJ60_9LAMI|nr:GATA-4/5/6 transcription factor [Handroanthus impetiginosus]
MVSDRKLANAVGGKSARPCDNCVRRRARWYCAADDAFLCESCDSSVHSANTLARRHERVRLKTESNTINSSYNKPKAGCHDSGPSWHLGFTKKARTPRPKKRVNPNNGISNSFHDLVPEICSEDNSHEDNEAQLLYRVPIFDPYVEELCNSNEAGVKNVHNESKVEGVNDFNHLQGFLPSETDLEEFAANVESLLGKGMEDESFNMEGLGLVDCDDEKGNESKACFLSERVIKVEDEEVGEQENRQYDVQFDMGKETFELNFDLEYSPITCEVEEDNKAQTLDDLNKINYNFLKLDHESVMSAWDDQKSPWTTGERPEFNSDGWPDCLGTSGAMHAYGDHMGIMSAHAAAMADRGREARVSRYREKRRTRLFSKKIRYEVRKLNAEKRPRMKGRFVKRANFGAPAPAPAPAFPLLSK